MLIPPQENFITEYTIRDPMKILRTLRGLPEFARGRNSSDDKEEFLWVVPQSSMGQSEPKAVAAVRIFEGNLQVGCPNKHTQRAMQILLECIVGGELVPINQQNQRLTMDLKANE